MELQWPKGREIEDVPQFTQLVRQRGASSQPKLMVLPFRHGSRDIVFLDDRRRVRYVALPLDDF